MKVDELHDAIDAAKLAGELLKNNFRCSKNIDSSLGKDIKLELDRKAEELVKSRLRSSTNFPILAEESDNSNIDRSSYHWIVDPLDGTYNYFRGNNNCAVSIALWKGDEPILGVIYNFQKEDLLFGCVGDGAYLNGEKLYIKKSCDIKQGALATGFPVSLSFKEDKVKKFTKTVNEFKKVRMVGSAAMSLYGVAVGYYDCYWEDSIMLWDVAAGLAVLQSLGGGYSISPTGKSFCYDVVASHSFLIVDYLKLR